MCDYAWDMAKGDGLLPVAIIFGSCRENAESYIGREAELIRKLSRHVNVQDVLVIYRYYPGAMFLQLCCKNGRFWERNFLEACTRDEAVAEVRRISMASPRQFGPPEKKL